MSSDEYPWFACTCAWTPQIALPELHATLEVVKCVPQSGALCAGTERCSVPPQ